MKLPNINRRRFLMMLGGGLVSAPLLSFADAKWIEPTWVKIRRLNVSKGKPSHRFIYFTDLHYKGDRQYAESVISTINTLSPEFVCFGGDIIEDAKFLPEALEILSGIKSPMFGVPGNHDYWSSAPFETISKSFASTGGAWLLNDQRLAADNGINIIGATCRSTGDILPPLNPKAKNILLIHYPAWAKKFEGRKFDLMLAGHSHGGQVRIPFYGSVIVPFGVDEYDFGLFETKSGPLYVNPGIGWYIYDVRFNCRPEITVIEI